MKPRYSSLLAMGWNSRPLSEADFFTFCETQGVEVVEQPMKRLRGFYALYKRPVIVLNSRLRGVDWLLTAWHEAGHHALHCHDGRFYTPGSLNKCEMEANIIAACALIPRHALDQMTPQEILDFLEVSVELRDFRYLIHARRGL